MIDNKVVLESFVDNHSEIMHAGSTDSESQSPTETSVEILEMPPLIPMRSIKFIKSMETEQPAIVYQKPKQIMNNLKEPNTTEEDDTSPIIINEPVVINITAVSFRAHIRSLMIRLLSQDVSFSALERCLPRGVYL